MTSTLHGCICRPDIERRHRDGIASVDVRHDAWCPAVNGGSQLVIARDTHESAAEFAEVIAQLLRALTRRPFTDVRIDGLDHDNPFENGGHP